jgi:hypothetical protein
MRGHTAVRLGRVGQGGTVVIKASIYYNLSQQGQHDSLRRGGDGRSAQVQTGDIQPSDLDMFVVDEAGHPHFQATLAPGEAIVAAWEAQTGTLILPKDEYSSVGRPREDGLVEVEWNVFPDWDDLLTLGRWTRQVIRHAEATAATEAAAESAAQAEVLRDFRADPTARAEKISEDYVTIKGWDFWLADIVEEAKQRWAHDQDALRTANRATLAAWVTEYGSDNQRERLAAGLLPWQEAHDSLNEHLFAPLNGVELYTRFEVSEVCVCPDDTCTPKFRSVDASELTADEWERFKAIRAQVPDATFQLREHQAKCASATRTKVKRGVIVKRTLDRLTFKREFAL